MYSNKFEKLTSEVDAFLNSIGKINITTSAKNVIWVSKDACLKDYNENNGDIQVNVVLSGMSKTFTLNKNLFENVSNVGDVASVLQHQIDLVYGYAKKKDDLSTTPLNERNLFVDVLDGSIVFKSKDSFSINFGSATDWLGFVTGNNAAQSNACMSVKIENPSISYSVTCDIDLNTLFATVTELKDLKIGDILDEIAAQCNAQISLDNPGVTNAIQVVGLELQGATFKIVSITEKNGSNFAAALGLTDKDENAEYFSAKAYLANDPNAAKFENLKLDIANVVDNTLLDQKSKVDVKGKFGVFDVNVTGDLGGILSYTRYIVDPNGLSSEGHISLVKDDANSYYAGGDKVLTVKTPGVTVGAVGNDVLATLTLENANDFDILRNWTLPTSSVYTYGPAGKGTGYNGLTMENVYNGLFAAVDKQLMNFFFDPQTGGVSNPTFLESFNLPMQGKSVLDLMDLRGKINEMSKCLSQGNGATLQELSSFFSQNLGVALNFSLTSAGIGVDITWNKVAVNQATELGGMDFGIEGFYLGGLVEAYLNMNLTLHAHIDLVYDANNSENDGFVATLANTPEKTFIDGFVYLTAANVVTDLHVSVLEKNGSQDSNRQGVFQIGEGLNGAARSRLFMCANVGAVHDTGANNATSNYRQAVAVRIGGELYASRYGLDAGVIKIGVAKDADLAHISCWDNDLNDYGNGYVWVEKGQELKSVAAWNKEDGGVYNTSAITTGELVVSLTGLTEQLKESFLFEKLRQVADGLNDTVRRLQSNLNLVLSKRNVRSIPLIGDSILGASDCLSDLYTKLVEPFRRYVYKNGGFDERSVAEKLLSLLGKYDATNNPFGLDKLTSLGTSGKWAGIQFDESYNDSGDEYVQYKSVENEAAYWRIRLRGSYNLAKDAAFDLGFAGLGLKADAGVNITLEWTLDIGFGISNKDGAFLLLSNGRDTDSTGHELTEADVLTETVGDKHAGDDFNLKLTVTPDAFIQGSLGFLALNGLLANNQYVLNLGIDLNDGNNSNENASEDWDHDKNAKQQINFSSLKSGLSLEAGLRGEVALDMGMTLGIGGYAMKMPHIDADFILNSGALPLENWKKSPLKTSFLMPVFSIKIRFTRLFVE